jgi:hypothetical protein
MLVKDLIQITKGVIIVMTNKKECKSFGFNLSIGTEAEADLMADLKNLKVIDIYFDCGIRVEVNFDNNFYNKYKEYFN